MTSYINNAGLLLAFVVAFYSLFAQWRRVPDVTKSTYILVLFSVFVLIIGLSIEVSIYFEVSFIRQYKDFIDKILGAIVYLFIFWRLLADYLKYYFYRTDSGSFLLLNTKRLFFKTNNESSGAFQIDFIKEVLKKVFFLNENEHLSFLNATETNNYSTSILATPKGKQKFNNTIYQLALEFLKVESIVQYTTSNRHPIEFAEGLYKEFCKEQENKKGSKNPNISFADFCKKEWDLKYKNNLILIDAHTKNYGFNERIYKAKSKDAKKYCREIITSDTSYPGIHSAIIKGHKIIREQTKITNTNFSPKATLLIYEDISSLIDIESQEQFRMFIRHVVASERLFGGMFTAYFESYLSIDNQEFLENIMDKSFITNIDIAYSRDEISQAIDKIAPKISAWIEDEMKNRKVCIITLMKGGEVFSRHLMEKITSISQIIKKDTSNLSFHSMRVSTYIDNNLKQQEPIIIDNSTINDYSNCSILVIDDICDSGKTLKKVESHLIKETNAVKDYIKTVVAINRAPEDIFKPSWSLFNYNDKYSQYPNGWMYGYGMDNNNDDETRKIPHFVFEDRFGGIAN